MRLHHLATSMLTLAAMTTILTLAVALLFGGPAQASAAHAPALSTSPHVLAADTLTRIEDVRRGALVHLQGTVTRILDEDEFRLEDPTGSIRVYIGWRNRVTVDVGERVQVRGVVDDDLVAAFRPEVYASEIIREDGTVIRLVHDG